MGPEARDRRGALVGLCVAGLLALYLVASTTAVRLPGDVPYPAAVLVLGLVVALARAVLRRTVSAVDLVAALAIAAMLATTAYETRALPLRDLGLYLEAGARWADGQAVYLTTSLAAPPPDPRDLPFVYPPLTLPLFGLLAALPWPAVAAGWTTAALAASYAALRLWGLDVRLALLLLLWPPIFQGIHSGNVAPFAFLLFALGPAVGGSLVLSAVFKVYNGVTALWLVREGRWRGLLAGFAAVATIVAATLPLTGLERWSEWIAGVAAYQASFGPVPDLQGMALARYVPWWAAVALGIGAVVMALLPVGIEGLRRLGVASAVISPSLFSHGFAFVLPSLMGLRSELRWLALGIAAGPALGPAWWLIVLVPLAAWVVPGLRAAAHADATG